MVKEEVERTRLSWHRNCFRRFYQNRNLGSWRDDDAKDWKLRNKASYFEAISAVERPSQSWGTGWWWRLPPSTRPIGPPWMGRRKPCRRVCTITPSSSSCGETWKHSPNSPIADRGSVTALDAPTSSEVTKLYQVHRADAVFAIGGADKTLQEQVAAAISGKRVLPVG